MNLQATKSRFTRKSILGPAAWAVCALMGMAAGVASAQTVVQRSFANQSFEYPYVTQSTGCFRTVPANWVPGWATTEAASNPAGFNSGCPSGTFIPPSNWDGLTPTQNSALPFPITGTDQTPTVIQLFHNTIGGVNAAAGVQWAELNADSNARLYREVCMIPGDVVDWALSHRARGNVPSAPGASSPTLPETMEFNIGTNPSGSASTMIMRGASFTDGSDSTPAESRCPGTLGSCTRSVDTSSGWVTYSGQFTWSSPAAKQTIGFQAISGMRNTNGTYSTNAGNYLDNINFVLKPFLQFTSSTATYTEGSTQPTVSVQIVGVLRSSITLNLARSGSSTATSGSDYTINTGSSSGGGTITIPAGDYGLGRTFNAPITFNDDTVIENNETLILTIPAPTSNDPYMLANTTACGVAPNNSITINIIDNDIDLQSSKATSTTTPVFGTPFTYTVIYANNTAATTAPATSHDAIAPVSDSVPTGLTFTSWTCTGAGGGTCAAASGTGAISGNATLPAGGSVTYSITATLSARTVCSTVRNTSTITLPSGFTEGTSVQSGYTSPAPGGTTNNTASVDVTPRCADLMISKTNTTASGTTDQASDTVNSGTPTTYTLLVENKGSAVDGAIIRDTPDATGLTCPGTAVVTCTGSNPSICPSATYTVADLTGSTGIVLGNFPANASATLTFSCTVK